MTRFLYLSDSHFGTQNMGYSQQVAYPARHPELLDALASWIRHYAPIDFVVHGGDMIDVSSIENIRQVVSLYKKMSVPVYLCLGNHDLTDQEARNWWLAHAPDFFFGKDVNYDLILEDCVLHVVPNQWSDVPYFWERHQNMHFLDHQFDQLAKSLRLHAGRPHILVTHAPARGLPEGQIGSVDYRHSAGDDFESVLNRLLSVSDDLRLVLTAHSHINMHVQEGNTHFVAASSFVEAPFEFKLVTVDHGLMSVETHGLGDWVSFPWCYCPGRKYVQGRACDRGFNDGLM